MTTPEKILGEIKFGPGTKTHE